MLMTLPILRNADGMNIFKSLAFWFSLLIITFFSGLLCVFLPWFIVLGIIFSFIFVAGIFIWPWLGFYTYSIALLLAPDFKLADVLTILVLALICIRIYFCSKKFYLLPLFILRPYILLIIIILFSLMASFFYFHNQLPLIYRDGRVFLYWLWLPVLYALSRSSPDGQKKIMRSIFGIAISVGIIAVFQSITGQQLVAAGRVGALETMGSAQENITRVQIPGYVFVMLGFIWTVVALVYKRINIVAAIIAVCIFVCALYVNFGRALWAWTLFAFIFSFVFLPRRQAINLAIIITLGGCISIGALFIIKPDVINNVTSRFESVQEEGGRSSSYGWRKLENEDALVKIIKSPIIGVAIGGEYRNWIPELRIFEDHIRYVHNSYFFLSLKLGLLGPIIVLWIIFRTWWHTLKKYRISEDKNIAPLRISYLVCVPAIIGLSVTQPELANVFGLLFISSIIAALVAPEIVSQK